VIDSAIETGTRAQKDRESGQSGLFAMLMEETQEADHPLPNVPDWTGSEKLTGEKEILGFYITGHPLDQYMDKVRELATHQTSTLEGLAKSTEVALCGILTGVNRRRNKDGKLWASMALEDLEGSIEAMVFSTQYERLNPVLNEDKAVLVRALVLPEENAPPKLSVQDIVPLENASVNLPSLISIRVPMSGPGDVDRCGMLQTLFTKKPGSTEVRLRLEKKRDFSVILDVTAKVRPDKEFKAEVTRICGAEALEVLAS
jgi:DNA polymerase-3 subunit alpha